MNGRLPRGGPAVDVGPGGTVEPFGLTGDDVVVVEPSGCTGADVDVVARSVVVVEW